MSSIENIPKNHCCGCNACLTSCPQNCISMQTDSEGFLYPFIDNTRCSKCGLCLKVCPAANKVVSDGKLEQPIIFAAWNNNEEIRKNSSSGGVFTTLAEEVIKQGGVVFGAAFKDDFHLVHKAVDEASNIDSLRGSKYIQSAIGDAYKQTKDYLKNKTSVLFSGTPCQIKGLYSYLGKDYPNLLTCDLVCHGVPSPAVFKEYINYLENKAKSKIVKFDFRNKQLGWKNYSVVVKFSNNKNYTCIFKKNSFMIGFLDDLFLRPSCYNCQYTGIPRIGDITLGDFWRIGTKSPALDDDKGTSLILINTDKGKKCLKDVKRKYFTKNAV